MNPLDRNGSAALSDLESPEWRVLYEAMEVQQREFLAQDRQFRGNDYVWPRDALHSWSRIWEYPYVYHHIVQCVRAGEGIPQKVVDVGSGITFFPVAVARLGAEVLCLDVDPVAVRGMRKAGTVLDLGGGAVDAAATEPERLPVDDASVDVVYSISVLEHTANPTRVLEEMVRILKPGGRLILTIDIDLRGDAAIGPAEYRRVAEFLQKAMETEHPREPVHPLDTLTSDNSPRRTMQPRGLRGAWRMAKQHIKPLLGRKGSRNPPYVLAVEGFCYRKKLEA